MEEYIPVSAIQHYSFCPRQCALIHCEKVFTENVFTLQGRYAHERVDELHEETDQEVKKVTSLRIWSDELGVTGVCDLVEFHDGQPFPIEYKSGSIQKAKVHDELQLCAQAMCLEEMFQKSVPKGAIYQVFSHKRRIVTFTDWHRQRAKEIVIHVRKLLQDGGVPKAVHDRRCQDCSLIEHCMPDLTNGQFSYDWSRELLKEKDEFET